MEVCALAPVVTPVAPTHGLAQRSSAIPSHMEHCSQFVLMTRRVCILFGHPVSHPPNVEDSVALEVPHAAVDHMDQPAYMRHLQGEG